MSLGEAIAPFIGRVILAWYFLSEAYARAISRDGTVSLLALQDVPAPALLHFLALTVMVLGSFALLLGFRARLGALGLFAVVIASNVVMNDFWNIADVIERQSAFDAFARNLAVGGGLMMVMGLGPGRIALER